MTLPFSGMTEVRAAALTANGDLSYLLFDGFGVHETCTFHAINVSTPPLNALTHDRPFQPAPILED